MSKNKCRIKKDDKVKVLAGKDVGKIGKVIRVDHKKQRVMVEHVNMVKRHQRPNNRNRQGGIIEGEAMIHWSNVMVVCSKCMSPVRVRMLSIEDGRKVRVCPKCNELMDA